MCITCGWKEISRKITSMKIKPEFNDCIDVLHELFTKIKTNTHVTTDDLMELNNLVKNERDRKVQSKVQDKVKTKTSPKEDLHFDPVAILMEHTELLENYKYVCNDGYYYWNERGLWNPLHRDYIDRLLSNYIPKNKTIYLNELQKFLQLSVLLEKEDSMNKDRYTLNLKNTMLDLKSGNQVPHHKQFLSTVQLNIDFNENEKCPKWEQFVHEVVDSKEDEMILQEYMGYCLVPETRFEKCLILVGTGANGKSTFLNVMLEIIGHDNISHISMASLSDKFSRINIMNKLVNIATELETGEVGETDYLKKIISGETIDARYLFKDTIHFKPFCRLIFAMNNLPHLRDKSSGLFRRLIIIEFPKVFEARANTNLANELLAERQGIFNWALIGLKRLYANERFTVSNRALEESKKYRLANNSVMGFCEEHVDIEVDPIKKKDNWIEKKIFYQTYKEWCIDNGLKPVSSITLVRDLRNAYTTRIGEGQENVHTNGTIQTRRHVLYGLAFKEV